MNISKVSTLTGLSPRQIREYEKLKLLAPVARRDSGYRHYTPADIERLNFIKHARDVNFSLGQIAQLLQLRDDPNRNNKEVKAVTHAHIVALTEKIEQLQNMKATLQTWHDNCRGDGSAECSILNGLTSGCYQSILQQQ
jgi:Cu(I)-responsive transcriptional regulator